MLDFGIDEYFQNEAIKGFHQVSPKLQYQRRIGIAHYLFSVIAGVFGLSVLLFSHMLAARYVDAASTILVVGVLCAALFVLLSQWLKRNARFLAALVIRASRVRAYLRSKTSFDPLYYQFVATVILVWLPLSLILAGVVIGSRGSGSYVWTDVGSALYARNVDVLKELMSFALTIGGAQLALFTFMFSYLLGKYSSRIVGAVVKHRAVVGLWGSSLWMFVVSWVLFSYGYPQLLQHLISPIFLFMTVVCLVLTVWVSISGIHPERGVLYASTRFGRQIRRSLKPCAIVWDGKPSRFWAILRSSGLDWRNPERWNPCEPPPRGLELVTTHMASLLNAANRAVDENSVELLRYSLTAILNLIGTYVDIRKTYFSSEDPVLTETNHQMAALLKATSSSSNEYMPTLVIQAVGNIGALSLKLAELPPVTQSAPVHLFGPVSKRHALSLLWAALLEEGFQLTHSLMRTSAPFEAIDRLTIMGLLSHQNEYYDTMATTFFAHIEAIDNICLSHPDAYHRELARRCIEGMLTIFLRASSGMSPWAAGVHDTFDQCAASIEKMAKIQFTLDKQAPFDPNVCGTILTSKSSDRQVVLQDVFYTTLSRSVSEDWQRRRTGQDLRKLLALIRILAEASLEESATDVWTFVRALYEVGYLLLRGLPGALLLQEEPPEEPLLARLPEPSLQELLQAGLFDVWRRLYGLLLNGPPTASEWKQHMAGLLGIGFAVLRDREDAALKDELVACIQELRRLIGEMHGKGSSYVDEFWAYLQLAGAWLYHLTDEKALAREIADEIGRLRPLDNLRRGYSSNSRFEPYGYPSVHRFSDFGLPRQENLLAQGYLAKDDISRILGWQALLMDETALLDYHLIVEKTRKPLREEFYRKLREQREKK